MKKIIKIVVTTLTIIIILSFFTACEQNIQDKEKNISSRIFEKDNEFINEQKVEILWYDWDAMEPYISRDEKYLFFNDNWTKTEKDLFYAEKVDDTTFKYIWEVKWVNTDEVDWNPTMDENYNFYFITTKYLTEENSLDTIYWWVFDNWELKNIKRVKWDINNWEIVENNKYIWINMGVEITRDWNEMYTSYAKFKVWEIFPTEGYIKYAIKTKDWFEIAKNQDDIMKNINTNYAVEYAWEVSDNWLDIFYSQVEFWKVPKFRLLHSSRNNKNEAFWIPKLINEPFKDDENAFVEGPTLSSDWKKLYYYKLDKWKFSIFMLEKNK